MNEIENDEDLEDVDISKNEKGEKAINYHDGFNKDSLSDESDSEFIIQNPNTLLVYFRICLLVYVKLFIYIRFVAYY